MFKAVLLLSCAAALSTLLPSPFVSFRTVDSPHTTSAEPSEEWKDDIWPIREQTPWDISTDYPFPRKLEYDVTEGTWLRLDVHPTSGDIVFDMLGDIYCLPVRAYRDFSTRTRAVPVLLGIPHDSDPHFSPKGDKIVFRSDAGLGLENIWVTPWRGCEAMDVRAMSVGERVLQEKEERLLASGVKETPERKERRLLREGRAEAQRVTNETYRWVSDARFHPSGSKVVATKWYTSSRSLGAGEGWEYEVPPSGPVDATSGKRLVGRTLPPDWSAAQYGDQQIGPEQFIWSGEDTLIYSKNLGDSRGQYSYSKDVHSGIYAIFSTNLTSKRTTRLVDAFPGGATRPELSRDGRTLAFVRRVRDKEALVLKDLKTGTIHNVWHGLTYDLGVISAPMGTYPSFAFTPADDAVIIWAAGQIYWVPLLPNARGERVAGGEPRAIPFKAHIEKRLAETVTAKTDIRTVETSATQRVYAFTELRVDESGRHAVFQGSGKTYVTGINNGESSRARPVPVLHPNAPYYSPSFVPRSDELVLHARWSDVNFTTFELANFTSRTAYELTGLPLGRYYSPILGASSGSDRQIAFLKTGGDLLTGDVVATAGAGLYIGRITLPSTHEFDLRKESSIAIEDLRFVPSEINIGDALLTELRFVDDDKKLLVQGSDKAFLIDLAAGPNELGDYPHEAIAAGRMSRELAVAPGSDSHGVAIVDFFQVYYAPAVKAGEPVWSKPGNATKGLARLSKDGGHSITFSGDGKKVFWFLGPYIHHVDVSKLSACASEITADVVNHGIYCTKKSVHFQEIYVEYPSEARRLQNDAAARALTEYGPDAVANADFFVITNATLLTMETGVLQSDTIRDAVLVTRGGQIEAIVGIQDYVAPYGATVVDVGGAFIVPGFIDVHAHWSGFGTTHPARSWEMETFLAYGVTTLHNPSADNVLGFTERFRLERGQLVGPRIFQVGDVIYGAAEPTIHQDIADLDEARSALIRIKAEGGPSSFSYKNYNQPSRASRQRLLLAARNLSMLCVPEGGMNWDWDITYIVDGMTTIEHALPIPVLYDDIIKLYASSGTGSTPTHIVNYGGVMGEQFVWATEDIPNDPKLRQFTSHAILEGLSETTSRPKNSFQVFNTSISVAKMVHMGLKAHIGAHGEPPLGLNYHAEMWFTQQGGLSNYEVIRAATSDAAATLGLDDAIGSLTPGKLADFLIYHPGVDLIRGDIRATRDLRFVVKGGRVWETDTLKEFWPVSGRREPMPPLNAE